MQHLDDTAERFPDPAAPAPFTVSVIFARQRPARLYPRSPTIHPTITDKRKELTVLCCRYGVARLEVFGFAARATDFDPLNSDGDFLVEFDPRRAPVTLERYCDFRDALHDALGRPVDLVEPLAIRNTYAPSQPLISFAFIVCASVQCSAVRREAQ